MVRVGGGGGLGCLWGGLGLDRGLVLRGGGGICFFNHEERVGDS